jgi:hypothetical protein
MARSPDRVPNFLMRLRRGDCVAVGGPYARATDSRVGWQAVTFNRFLTFHASKSRHAAYGLRRRELSRSIAQPLRQHVLAHIELAGGM